MTFFVIKFFLTIPSYEIFKNYWIFINHGLFFGKKFSTTLLFPISKICKKNLKYSYLKKMFLLMISGTENFNFGTGNSRVVENIIPEK